MRNATAGTAPAIVPGGTDAATPFRDRSSRAAFICAVVAAGAGLGARGLGARRADAATPSAACSSTIQGIISTALAAEQIATTFYYAALTSPELMGDSQLGGSSIDPNHPGLPPNGNPGNVRFLQAALDAELKHATTLYKAGAASAATHFYFPKGTFRPSCAVGQLCTLGSSTDPNTFLGVLEVLETAFIGAYLAAIRQFVELGHPELAELAANVVGVEAEHRAVARVIADAPLPNNLTLERLPFACVGDAAVALRPFLTGEGFAAGATAAIASPSAAQVAVVVGPHGSRIVGTYA